MNQDQIRRNIEMMGYRVPYGPIDCRPGIMIPIVPVSTSIWDAAISAAARFLGL